MKKIIYNITPPQGPYSQAVEANGMLYISGQIPVDPATGKIVEGGIKEQTDQAMKNVGAILKAAGCTFADVIKSTCLLDDIKNYPAFNEVYARYYGENPPARATFAVAGLPLGVMVEIETIAVK